LKLTLGQAAKETGVSKSTLSKAVKSGRISADRQADGSLSIDVSEFFRVYQKQPFPETQSRTDGHPRETGNNNGLSAELQMLRERLSEKDSTIADLRGERDRLLAVVEEQARSVRLLTDQRRAQAAPSSAPPKGLWRRLFGT
jgi:hypothetical protein